MKTSRRGFLGTLMGMPAGAALALHNTLAEVKIEVPPEEEPTISAGISLSYLPMQFSASVGDGILMGIDSRGDRVYLPKGW